MGRCLVQKSGLQGHQILLPKARKLVHNETHCETIQAKNNKTGASCNGTRSLCGAPSTLEAMPKLCTLCQESEQTSAHLWAECPALSLERMNLIVDQRPLNYELNIVKFFDEQRIQKNLLKNLGEGSQN